MPLLIVLLPLLFQLGSQLLNGANNAAKGKYNKALFALAIAGLAYYFVSAVNKSKQQTYLNNAGKDLPTQQAQALKDAFNKSGVDWLQQFDGTDVELVMQTAAQITKYDDVADAYRVLYPGSELTTDLQKELSRTDLQRFWNIVYQSNSTPSTGSGGTTSGSSLVGKTVTAKQTVNVRLYKTPSVSEYQAKAGEVIGTYVGEMDLTVVNGKKDRFVHVKKPVAFGLFDLDYYVHKGSVKIG